MNDPNRLVSVIMPAYNAAKYIRAAIDSVIAQTYPDWELIIIDDFSTDETQNILNEYTKKDPRIKLFQMNQNSGSALARSKGISMAKGRYIAFLDGDDLWFQNKLEEQISFMETNHYPFTCTSYIKIDENGKKTGIIIKAYDKYDYNTLLKRCPGNLTVIYDTYILGKFQVYNIKCRTDYVLWIQVIKKAKNLYGLTEPLAAYRITSGSLSRKKIRLIKYHWYIYRKIEGLSITKSIYLIFYIIIRKLMGQ